MKLGTKSVLFGAHCFFIHPWFVAFAWYKLFGFPWDLRLWFCFFVHDLGYFGKPNMDGPEGEKHVELGAYWASKLFDRKTGFKKNWDWIGPGCIKNIKLGLWGRLCLYHSRYYAKKDKQFPSPLCFADKLSLYYTPWWIYLPMVNLTGEIKEYYKNAETADSGHWQPMKNPKQREWYQRLQLYMSEWVYEHLDGKEDTWTNREKRDAA